MFLSYLCLLIIGSIRPNLLNVEASSGSSEIDVSSLTESNCSCKLPVTFNAPIKEQWTFTYTGCALEVMSNPATTNATVTGGSFGNEEFKYYKFLFYWRTFKHRVELVSYVLYYDEKYNTFEEALKDGGVFLIIIPIEANGLINNLQFCIFEDVLLHKLKTAGDKTNIKSLASYNFMRNFALNTKYVTYKGSYCDDKTDECYSNVTVIQYELEKWRNFISISQYKATFGKLADNPPPEVKKLSAPLPGVGTVVHLR